MGLISRVSSRTYSKTGELGEEHLVYSRQSAKARKHNTPSKSPTSPSCYFQPGKYRSSTNSPVRYNKTQSLRKHHSLSKIKLNYGERKLPTSKVKQLRKPVLSPFTIFQQPFLVKF